MSKIKCIFGLHEWSDWYRGLQPLTDDLTITETKKCPSCGKYKFRRVAL